MGSWHTALLGISSGSCWLLLAPSWVPWLHRACVSLMSHPKCPLDSQPTLWLPSGPALSPSPLPIPGKGWILPSPVSRVTLEPCPLPNVQALVSSSQRSPKASGVRGPGDPKSPLGQLWPDVCGEGARVSPGAREGQGCAHSPQLMALAWLKGRDRMRGWEVHGQAGGCPQLSMRDRQQTKWEWG